jgi:hypothetical protein
MGVLLAVLGVVVGALTLAGFPGLKLTTEETVTKPQCQLCTQGTSPRTGQQRPRTTTASSKLNPATTTTKTEEPSSGVLAAGLAIAALLLVAGARHPLPAPADENGHGSDAAAT